MQFDGIAFAYDGYTNILKHLSLHIPAGTTIGIVEATGSGKSTLVKLLLRFSDWGMFDHGRSFRQIT